MHGPGAGAEKLHPDLQASGRNSNSKYCGVLENSKPTTSGITPPIRPQLQVPYEQLHQL